MNRYYIFELNENVHREHVKYQNRYEMEIAADLYTSQNMNRKQKYPAIIVGPPYGGVKEQGPGVYANELAQRGFVVLAFDYVYMGESGGKPRHISSPDIFTENISASVDFIGMLPYVDQEKIAVIGICGSGGFALSATAMDTRIQAVIAASYFDTSVASRLTAQQIQERKEQLSKQRWLDAKEGTPEYIPSFPQEPVNEIPNELQGIVR